MVHGLHETAVSFGLVLCTLPCPIEVRTRLRLRQRNRIRLRFGRCGGRRSATSRRPRMRSRSGSRRDWRLRHGCRRDWRLRQWCRRDWRLRQWCGVCNEILDRFVGRDHNRRRESARQPLDIPICRFAQVLGISVQLCASSVAWDVPTMGPIWKGAHPAVSKNGAVAGITKAVIRPSERRRLAITPPAPIDPVTYGRADVVETCDRHSSYG